MRDSLAVFARRIAETLRLMCGVPDYDRYVAHRRARHPGEPVMSFEDFFRERQAARFGQGRGCRCC